MNCLAAKVLTGFAHRNQQQIPLIMDFFFVCVWANKSNFRIEKDITQMTGAKNTAVTADTVFDYQIDTARANGLLVKV